MKLERKKLLDLFRVYAVQGIEVENQLKLFYATEGQGACTAFFGDDFTQQETVWDQPGGTMSIIEIPGKKGEFLAVQRFYPTFDSKLATLVHGRYVEGKWVVEPLIDIPYVHRFDVLRVGEINYLVVCTLATTKEDRDDWSNPGKILVSILPDDLSQPIELKSIKDGCTRNHGYYRGYYQGHQASYVTCDEGVFVAVPPQSPEEKWQVDQILDRHVSDIAVFDIDQDGEDELITIEPFHGNGFNINKKINGEYKVVYSYPHPIDFAHVVWAGILAGEPTILGGVRRIDQELFRINCTSKSPLTFKETIIEKGGGPSNICVIHRAKDDLILVANREKGEGVLYTVTNDGE